MPTVLHVDSSPPLAKPPSPAISPANSPSNGRPPTHGNIITRDLTTTTISSVSAAWIAAVHTPADALTPAQKDLLSLSDTLIAKLFTADEFVFGVPMHNFGVPSVLKLWIDQIARANKTFSYATGSPVGLLTGKKATLLIATGGNYDAGTAKASYNFVEPYLRTVLGFVGVTDVTAIVAGGTAALNYGADRPTFLEPHVEAVRATFQAG